MQKTLLVGLVLAAVLVGRPSAQDAKTVVANAARTLGVDTLKTVHYSATGYDFALGQAPNPTSPWRKFVNKSYSRTINFTAKEAGRFPIMCSEYCGDGHDDMRGTLVVQAQGALNP